MMRKIWLKWCNRVEEHNSRIEDGSWENMWSPFDIFNPIIMSVIISFFICGFTGVFAVRNFMVSFLFPLIITSLVHFINWKIYEVK